MYLIYYIYLIFSLCRRILHLLLYISYIVNTVISRGIYLKYVYGTALKDMGAGCTFVAGITLRRTLTVYRSRKYLCNRGLSCSSCTTKEIGMAYPPCIYLIF